MNLADARREAQSARERWIAAPRGSRAEREAALRRATAHVLALELAEARADGDPEPELPYWKKGQLA
ncbi:MAG: hypothetical protein NBV67_00880 [Tagaea sp.]|nr:hypothetical protein [Tagaea sp.]